jgi:regulatory protein
MPVVTGIKRQKRSDTKVNVYLDGKYTFVLSDLELSTSGLRVGQELSAEEVLELKSRSEIDGVYSKAVRFVGIRPRSRREVVDYLRRKGVDDEIAVGVLGRLERVGLLNDEAFAASWVSNRQLLRPRSRRRLEQELSSKGVSRDDIEVALGELEPEQELESLALLIERKQRLPQYRDAEKLMGYLARQGYSYELIKKALEKLSGRSDE